MVIDFKEKVAVVTGGAGGIGAPLIFAIQSRNWDKVSIILLGVVVMVFVMDLLTGMIRKKLR